jgi:hypothetical protein
MKRFVATTGLLACASLLGSAQQVPDLQFAPAVLTPTFAANTGPTILVDEGHGNGHTLGETLTAFGKLVRADGFAIKSLPGTFTKAALGDAAILMISNAAAPPQSNSRSAFTQVEIRTVREWVQMGGALLLIADHMPAPAAAADLAQAFDVQFMNGFTLPKYMTELDEDKAYQASYDDPSVFTRATGTLKAHAITNGSTAAERVEQVATFTGQGFRGRGVAPLLVFPSGFVSIFPDNPWEFRPTSRRTNGQGLLQGGVKKVGKGRSGFFGEAAMFTAQRYGRTAIPMGLNHPLAKENAHFILNLLHWLVGRL